MLIKPTEAPEAGPHGRWKRTDHNFTCSQGPCVTCAIALFPDNVRHLRVHNKTNLTEKKYRRMHCQKSTLPPKKVTSDMTIKGNCSTHAGPDSPSICQEMTRWLLYLLKPLLVIYACFTIFHIRQMGRDMFSAHWRHIAYRCCCPSPHSKMGS